MTDSPAAQYVIFDTNVLIPLMLTASRSTRLFDRLEAAGWYVALSPQILAEVSEKLYTKERLRTWLNVTASEIDEFVQQDLPGKTVSLHGDRQAHGAVPADPKDDKIIAAALEANASYIISEDRHLLDLQEYEGIQIMNRQAFAAELDRLGVG